MLGDIEELRAPVGPPFPPFRSKMLALRVPHVKSRWSAPSSNPAPSDTASASITVNVENGATGDTGGSTTTHVGDLDGTATTTKNEWYATVTVTVVDGAGNLVAEATVEAAWRTLGSQATCTTDATGTCTVTSPRVRKNTEALTLDVANVTHGSLTYDAAANTDPDTDSTGTTITVKKPA